jgi:hypothetical protein
VKEESDRPCQTLAQHIGALQGQVQTLIEDRASAARGRERIYDKLNVLQSALDQRLDELSKHVDAKLASLEARTEARVAAVAMRVDALEGNRDQGAGVLWTLRALWLAAGGAVVTVGAWLADRIGMR